MGALVPGERPVNRRQQDELIHRLLQEINRPGLQSLRRGLQISNGDLTPFFTRPVCAVLAAVTIFTLLMYIPAFNRAVRGAWAALSRRLWRFT